MIKVIPAIIAKSYEEFESMIKKVEPYTNRVHLDIMDGEFVENSTIDGYEELAKFMESFPETKLKFEVHLMINKPEDKIDNWLKTAVDKYLIHFESTDKDLTNSVKPKGHLFGLVLNPETDISEINDWVSKIDLVQLMSVHPGYYGREFLPEIEDKIKALHLKHPDLPIQVDGGINKDTAKIAIEAGANILVSGSYIMKSENPAQAIKDLENKKYV